MGLNFFNSYRYLWLIIVGFFLLYFCLEIYMDWKFDNEVRIDFLIYVEYLGLGGVMILIFFVGEVLVSLVIFFCIFLVIFLNIVELLDKIILVYILFLMFLLYFMMDLNMSWWMLGDNVKLLLVMEGWNRILGYLNFLLLRVINWLLESL